MLVVTALSLHLDVVEVRWRHRHERACRAVMMSALNPIMPRTMTPFELHWQSVLDQLAGARRPPVASLPNEQSTGGRR